MRQNITLLNGVLTLNVRDKENNMKKLVAFMFLLSLVFACNNGKLEKPSEEVEKQKPVLKKLEILKVSDGSSLKVFEEFKSNTMSGFETEEEKVKIKFDVDLEVKVYFNPDLPEYKFPLTKIGNNTLNIILEKDGLQNVYILTIKRNSKEAEIREIKELRFTTDYAADADGATLVNRNASDDKLFELELSHIYAERKYFIFVEGKDESDVVFIEGKIAPYPKANKQRIEVGNLAKATGETKQDFYIFKEGVDTSNLGLATKYTLKIAIKKEPNTKIKSVKFNEEAGNIDGNKITCEHEFEVGTSINTTLELEDATSTYTVNAGNPVAIAGNGAKFNIVVVPEEGESFKETYSVVLKAKTTEVKKITGIKYVDQGPTYNIAELNLTADRNKDNVCLIDYTSGISGNLSFLPVPENDIKNVEKDLWGSYSEVQKLGVAYVIQARDLRNITTKGIKIRVTFNDDTTDEFIIKAKE